jgi:hypothetical protein
LSFAKKKSNQLQPEITTRQKREQRKTIIEYRNPRISCEDNFLTVHCEFDFVARDLLDFAEDERGSRNQ